MIAIDHTFYIADHGVKEQAYLDGNLSRKPTHSAVFTMRDGRGSILWIGFVDTKVGETHTMEWPKRHVQLKNKQLR